MLTLFLDCCQDICSFSSAAFLILLYTILLCTHTGKSASNHFPATESPVILFANLSGHPHTHVAGRQSCCAAIVLLPFKSHLTINKYIILLTLPHCNVVTALFPRSTISVMWNGSPVHCLLIHSIDDMSVYCRFLEFNYGYTILWKLSFCEVCFFCGPWNLKEFGGLIFTSRKDLTFGSKTGYAKNVQGKYILRKLFIKYVENMKLKFLLIKYPTFTHTAQII